MIALTTIAIAVSACGGDADTPEVRDVVVRDSAGITIVENGAAPTRPGIVLDTVAEVDIGERDDDDPDYQLFRVTHAVRRTDGAIVVANSGSSEIRVYDAAGAFLQRIGRDGAGPGEFEQLDWLALAKGDTILAFDRSGRRLSRFTPTGEYAGALVLGGASATSSITPLGLLGDGRMVADGGSRSGGRNTMGLSRDTLQIVLIGADGVVQDTVAGVLGRETSVQSSGSGDNGATLIMPSPYGRTTTFGVHGDAIAIGTADSYEVRLLDTTGGVRRIVRRRVDPMPVTEDDGAALREQRISTDMPAPIREMLERRLAASAMPPSMPPYSTILLDRVERLWVREATHAREAARWAVYGRDGGLIGELTLPARFRVTDAGEDFILGILRDDEDLERVQLYRVRTANGVTASVAIGVVR